MDAYEPWCTAVGSMKIKVVKAQGLYAADRSMFKKSSDPYVRPCAVAST